MSDFDSSTNPCDTFPKLLLRNSRERASEPAFRQKNLGIWQTISWEEAADIAREFSLGLLSLGLKRDDKIAIIGQNTSLLYLSIVAIQGLGGVPVPIYPDATTEEMGTILEHADVRCTICQDQEQIDKVENLRSSIPSIKFLIFEEPRGMRSYSQTHIHSIESLLTLGRESNPNADQAFENEVFIGKGSDLSAIFYTPGTTDRPKGVMLTHNSLLAAATLSAKQDGINPNENVLAYLPIAWIGDHLISFAQHHVLGFTINCPESPDTLLADLKDIGPSYFLAPPRIFEQMYSEINTRIDSAAKIKKSLYSYFVETAKKIGHRLLNDENIGVTDRVLYILGQLIIYGPIKNTLGFNNIKIAYNAGAAISEEVFMFYRAIGVNLQQLYMQTESAGYVCHHQESTVTSDTLGQAAPQVELKIDEHGEIIYQSPGNFAGYYKDDEATKAAVDPKGWFKSGDTGELTDTGALKILGRKSEIGQTSKGENFTPQYIENKLRVYPFIREAVTYGLNRPFVSAIVTIDVETVGALIEQMGEISAGYGELSERNNVYDLVQSNIETLNEILSNDIASSHLQIQRFLILPRPFSFVSGEFTQMGKLRRHAVDKNYKTLVDAIYSGQDTVEFNTVTDAKTDKKNAPATNIKIRTIKT